MHVMPELFRLNNNIRRSGIFQKGRSNTDSSSYLLLKIRIKRSLIYIPAINWTRENGFMIGMALNNGFLIPKPVEYFVMPFYSFNGSRTGRIRENFIQYHTI